MSIKKIIRLEAIDPIEIYGAANRNLESLCSYFPELKVVARGEEIILEGTDTDVTNFEQKLMQLIDRRQHKRNITPYDVEDLFDGESSPDRYKLCGNSVIVHGTTANRSRRGTGRRRKWSRLILKTTSSSL